MNRYSVIPLVSWSLALVLACSDDSGSDTGQGGTQSASNGGSQNGSNAGAAGSSSMSGSGGSNSGSSGAGGGGSGNGGTAGSGSGNAAAEDVCQRGCLRTEPLNCPADPTDCEAACLAEYLDFPEQCRDLVLVFGECAADRPTSDYLCDETGEATLRDGVCETESLAAAACIFGGL